MQHHEQTTSKPIVSASSAEHDILAAAKSRAAFWKYPAGASWTVSVSLPGGRRDVEVRYDGDGRYEVLNQRKAA